MVRDSRNSTGRRERKSYASLAPKIIACVAAIPAGLTMDSLMRRGCHCGYLRGASGVRFWQPRVQEATVLPPSEPAIERIN